MPKNKFTIELNDENDSASDEELTVKKQEIGEQDVTGDTEPKKRTNKSGKPRAPYVLTEKRKKQFELAREVRMKNIADAKAKQNESFSQYNDLKQELEKKKLKKLEKIKKKELVKLMAETENISTDDDEDSSIETPRKPPAKPPKPPKTKAKKQLVVESETETESSESEQESVKKAPKKKTTTKKKAVPQEKPKEKPKEYTTPSFGIRYI